MDSVGWSSAVLGAVVGDHEVRVGHRLAAVGAECADRCPDESGTVLLVLPAESLLGRGAAVASVLGAAAAVGDRRAARLWADLLRHWVRPGFGDTCGQLAIRMMTRLDAVVKHGRVTLVFLLAVLVGRLLRGGRDACAMRLV